MNELIAHKDRVDIVKQVAALVLKEKEIYLISVWTVRSQSYGHISVSSG